MPENIKYFLYSSEQLKMRKEAELRMGRKFKVGHVIVNGVRKPFTELSSTGKSRYSDAKIVAQGNPDLMRYTEPGGD
jgi:hypothetical protein